MVGGQLRGGRGVAGALLRVGDGVEEAVVDDKSQCDAVYTLHPTIIVRAFLVLCSCAAGGAWRARGCARATAWRRWCR